jgi:GH24 family phage-related lysozyme (muramidase)
MVMIGLDYRKLGYDLLELLNPVAEAANRFLVWVNKQTPAKRDTILGGVGILGTLTAWLAGKWILSGLTKAVARGVAGTAAAGETAAVVGGTEAVGAGTAAAAGGGGILATIFAPEVVIPAVIAVLAGLGIWWLIDKVKKDGWSGGGDSAAWQETKDFWSSVGGGIATAAKAVGRGTEAAGKWVANLTGDAFTKAAEGLRHFAYPDAGKMAIGYGHQILPGENFAGGVTTAQADALYKSDMGKAQATVAKLTAGLKLSKNQLGALADYQFNTGALANSHILALIRAGKYDEAAKAFETSRVTSRGVYNPGLFSRRQGEERMFLDGIPGASNAAAYTPSSQTTSRSVTTNIGEVHVHTTASDAHGIAKDMKSSLDYRFAVQAQAGLG